jgi:oxygen-independent coproporphyrinogen-3 oxidase
MISLRTVRRIRPDKIEKFWGVQEKNRIQKDLASYINNGFVRMNSHHAQLTDEGMLRADGIAADLFV